MQERMSEYRKKNTKAGKKKKRMKRKWRPEKERYEEGKRIIVDRHKPELKKENSLKHVKIWS